MKTAKNRKKVVSWTPEPKIETMLRREVRNRIRAVDGLLTKNNMKKVQSKIVREAIIAENKNFRGSPPPGTKDRQSWLINRCVSNYLGVRTEGEKSATRTQNLPTPKHPVPEWMDDELKSTAGQLDIVQRHELADRLEKQAAELRGLQQPVIEFVAETRVGLRPNMKRAIIEYVARHGAAGKPEDIQLNWGVRWILQTALTKIGELSDESDRQVRYLRAEDLEPTNYFEKLIGDALETWQTTLTQSNGESDVESL